MDIQYRKKEMQQWEWSWSSDSSGALMDVELHISPLKSSLNVEFPTTFAAQIFAYVLLYTHVYMYSACEQATPVVSIDIVQGVLPVSHIVSYLQMA